MRRIKLASIVAGLTLLSSVLFVSPALAACAQHNHQTWYNEGSWYSSSYQYKPSGTSCNDINTSWVSDSGSYKAQYWNGSWVTGSAGWVWHNSGSQSPWKVLITNLNDGIAYKIGQWNSGRQATVRL